MKLTNTQLNVLVRTIWYKIEAKIESLKSTPEYAVAKTSAKAAIKYDERLSYATEAEKIYKKIEALQTKREELRKEYVKKFDLARWYDLPSKSSVDEILESKTIEILKSDLPSKDDLESDIILTAMAPGANDIISALTTKYGL